MRPPTNLARTALAGLMALAAVVTLPAAAGAGTPDTVPVPAGFLAQSTTWISPDHGWVLGSRPCGHQTCAGVIETTDTGATWHWVGRAGAPLAVPGEPGIPGISDIRFADTLHGWEFGPSLYSTDDGGRTWQPEELPGHGQRLLAFAADAVAAYAMVSPCRASAPISQCHRPTTLWRLAIGSGSWTAISADLPIAYSGVIKLREPTVYAIVQEFSTNPDAFVASTDSGATFSTRPSPCLKDEDEILADVAPIDASRLGLLCIGDPGFSKSVKHVFRSIDTGLNTTPAGTAPLDGIQADMAAAPDVYGPLLIASSSYGSFMYRSEGADQWTEPLAIGDGGKGWNDPTFTTALTAYVVHSPANMVEPAGELLVTQDAGSTWAPVDFYSGG